MSVQTWPSHCEAHKHLLSASLQSSGTCQEAVHCIVAVKHLCQICAHTAGVSSSMSLTWRISQQGSLPG